MYGTGLLRLSSWGASRDGAAESALSNVESSRHSLPGPERTLVPAKRVSPSQLFGVELSRLFGVLEAGAISHLTVLTLSMHLLDRVRRQHFATVPDQNSPSQ